VAYQLIPGYNINKNGFMKNKLRTQFSTTKYKNKSKKYFLKNRFRGKMLM